MYRKTYFLSNELRGELKKVWGVPFLGRKDVVKRRFQEFCREKKFKKIITVGDYCSLTLPSDIKIFDGRVGRNKKVPLQKYSYSCWNPPASINKDVWKILKKALAENSSVFVEGEEDLLVIPVVLLAKRNTAVVYGFVNRGACLIEISPEIKKTFRKLLGQFRKEKFKKIILGGTFNKLHSGHRYFLSLAGYFAKKALVGLCSDQMVKIRKKRGKNVQTFEERKRALKEELRKIGLRFEIVELNDIYGPAIKDKEAEAILLTEDTYPNGEKINKIRKKNKLKELHRIILPYLLDGHGKKISSGNS